MNKHHGTCLHGLSLHIIHSRLGCAGVFTLHAPSIPVAFSSATERVWDSNRLCSLWFHLGFHSWQRLLPATLLYFLRIISNNVISTLQLFHFIFCSICSTYPFFISLIPVFLSSLWKFSIEWIYNHYILVFYRLVWMPSMLQLLIFFIHFLHYLQCVHFKQQHFLMFLKGSF